MSKFHALKIKDIRQETADCVSIAFDVPMDLQPVFAYKSGQYLTFRAKIDGKDVRRSYSICSSPLDSEWRIAVKKVENGVFSGFANTELKRGDSIDVMPPSGHFIVGNSVENNAQNYVFFAAGSGITPIISHIKTLLRSDKTAHCTLVYGNQRTSSIVFREEIEALKNQFMSRFKVVHILSRERTDVDVSKGRLDAAKMAVLFEKMPDILRGPHFFICGPEDMTLSIKAALINKNIDPKNIHFELFGTQLKSKKALNTSPKTSDVPSSIATIKMDGITFDVPIFNDNSVLDAALEAGADLPFACKGGVCCTCRAKLIEGKVEMSVNYSLTEEEVANGFILTCQAVPLTARVVVDFDVK
jgi:ring-1,2-phenylacetyl-CoA epoxidase subunit PaaE